MKILVELDFVTEEGVTEKDIKEHFAEMEYELTETTVLDKEGCFCLVGAELYEPKID